MLIHVIHYLYLLLREPHELEAGDPPTLDHFKCDKAVGKALEEIAAGKVTVDPAHAEVNLED